MPLLIDCQFVSSVAKETQVSSLLTISAINSPLLLSAAVNHLLLCLSFSIQGIILHKFPEELCILNILNCSAWDVCKMSINFIWIHGTCDAFTNRLDKVTHNKVSRFFLHRNHSLCLNYLFDSNDTQIIQTLHTIGNCDLSIIFTCLHFFGFRNWLQLSS